MRGKNMHLLENCFAEHIEETFQCVLFMFHMFIRKYEGTYPNHSELLSKEAGGVD